MIRGLHHASITTADIERLSAFYRDLLGFDVVLRTSWPVGNATADAIFNLRDTAVEMVMLKTANAFLELFQFANPVGAPGDPDRPVCDQGITHICLIVDDLDAEYARLKAAGMSFHYTPQAVPGLCRATYGRDPDGNIIELLQPDSGGPFAVTNLSVHDLHERG
jgi:catechol 2,3-dioxygenase-like lactoylglutathione lyase family enzyme